MKPSPDTIPEGCGIAKRVLIIEKGKTHRRVFEQLVASHGWDFQFADKLEEVRSFSGEEPPYLHFVDSHFREDDIKEYVARLKKRDAAHTVLALCDEASRPKARRLMRHGLYDCVQKPFQADEILHALERSHERARQAREIARRGEETAALEHAIASVIFSTKRIARHLALEDFCRALMHELAALFDAAGGSFYLAEGDRLVRVYSLDPGHAPDEIELPLAEESFLGLAHKTGRPVLASDIVRERCAAPSGFSGYKAGYCLVLPVFHNGEELVAFISLHDKRAAAFSHRDRTIGAALAAVSSGFLRVLRALGETRERESRYEHFFKEGLTLNFIALPDGRISHANTAFYRAFCDGAPTAAGMSIVPFFPKKEDWETLVRRLRKDKTIDHLEAELVDALGARRLLFGNLVANSNERSELVSVSAAFFDVTQKKLLERELNHSLKMVALGRLAGGVVHDFNNLITAILGYCEVVKDRVTDREMAEEIEGIRRAGEKASILTRQLLSLSRKEARGTAPVNLADLVRELDRLFARVIGENIELVSSFRAAEPVILADRAEIEQLIMNLVVNARDAMPAGGRIRVSIAEENVAEAAGRYVVLRVSDEGVGMDEETQRRIFEPYFSTKDKGTGTGLGLALVYGIVNRAGGFISVTSAPAQGSTFSLYFPKAAVTPPESAPAPAAAPPCAGDEDILVVDDEQVVCQTVARVLKKYGYTVCVAGDGKQALALAREARRPFACAVIDLVMPGMGGAELAAELKKIIPGLKVLLVSGYAPGAVGKHLPNGIREDDLVTKPFHQEVLARKVREILDRKD